MSYVKKLVEDILEALVESNYDFESVANKFSISPSEVFEVAQEYGDIDTALE